MRCAVYVRKSRKDSGKAGFRLESQRNYLPFHATSLDWRVEVYDDGHASASKDNLGKLTARNRLENDIRAGNIDVVLVIELSRLSRDESMEDFVTWLALCAERKVLLATPGRVLNPAEPSDWMLLLMEAGFSSVEMKVLKVRMSQGRKEAFRSGVWLGGTPPRPYTYDENLRKMVVDQEDLLVMQKVWALIETQSAQSVAEQIGLPLITVRRAISDHYLLLYQAKRIHPETGALIDCKWPAIMTAEQAKRIRAARKTRKTNGERKPFAALLSALAILRCGYCGKTVKTWSNNKTRKDGSREDYYGCRRRSRKGACPKSRSIPQSILNEKVLTNVFRTIGCLESLMEAWHVSQEDSDFTTSLDDLNKRENNLLQQKARLVAAVAEGVLGLDEIKEQKKKIESEITSIGYERTEIMAQVSEPPDWGALTLTRDEFADLDVLDQRRFLQTVIDKVTIYHDSAIIAYRFPRAADGSRKSRIHLPPPQRGRRITKPRSKKRR